MKKKKKLPSMQSLWLDSHPGLTLCVTHAPLLLYCSRFSQVRFNIKRHLLHLLRCSFPCNQYLATLCLRYKPYCALQISTLILFSCRLLICSGGRKVSMTRKARQLLLTACMTAARSRSTELLVFQHSYNYPAGSNHAKEHIAIRG